MWLQRAYGSSPLVFLLDSLLSGLETVPLQSRTASRTNVDEHFISAEECVRIFPKKLKDSFRVTCSSLHHSFSKAPPCSPPHSSYVHEFWYPVRPGSHRGHTETGNWPWVEEPNSESPLSEVPVNTDRNKETPLREHDQHGTVDLVSGTGSLACMHQTSYACSLPARVCTKC